MEDLYGLFFKKSNTRSKGEYLQIYESYYVKGKGGRHRSIEALGYVSDLIKNGIPDPISYGQNKVKEYNDKNKVDKEKQIGEVSLTKRVRHFLASNMFDYLGIDEYFNKLAINKKFHFDYATFIRNMVYAQILQPGSKYQAFEKVIPSLYNGMEISYDQILDATNYMGQNYENYIEVINKTIDDKFGKRTLETAFFDCTNYYFEIDAVFEDKQKGPSKENRKDPIIGQALLLDENQIPIAMKMYPGNESEKPYIREIIKDMKERYDIDNKIVQAADKGLNCARNIYAATVESNDGYVFSKTFRGKGLSKKEKEWTLLEDNNKNIWSNYTDISGNVLYKLKECIDEFSYSFDDVDDNGKTKKIEFKIKEKRIVSYNPALARKQIREINKEVEKLRNKLTVKGILKEELGDASKYCNAEAFDKNGELVNISIAIDEEKIKESKAFAGYNLLVTSEVNKSKEDIYKIYHGLSRIEESFRFMKTYLEARPVFAHLKETIYGHFLICYTAFTIMRLIELKLFKDQIPLTRIFEFMRSYNMTLTKENAYINGATLNDAVVTIKEVIGARKLTNAFFSKKDLDLLFDLHLDEILCSTIN